MTDWILNLLETAGYMGLAFLMVLENVFPPIPSELVMPLAGFLVDSNKLTLIGVITAGTLGSVVGAWVFYAAGRIYGKQRLYTLAQKHGSWIGINTNDLDKAQQWFDNHGAATVFFCRLIPGLRSLISIPAGIAEQNIFQFSLYTTAGSALWCGLLAFLGMKLGENYADIKNYIDPISWIVISALLFWYLHRIWRSHKTA